jgi:stage V sporulation protein S
MSAWEGGAGDEQQIAQLKAQIDLMTTENNALREAQGLPVPDRSNNRRNPSNGGKGGGNRKAADGGKTDLGEYDGRIIWVSGESTTQIVSKGITGAALPSARKGFPVYIFSKYSKNTNVGIKGVVSAQRILFQRHSMYVGVTPSFRGNRKELTLKVDKLSGPPPHVADPTMLESAIELSVAAGTDPKSLAGAIAAHSRGGNSLSIRAIGANAVFEMLVSVGIARSYLSDDGNGQDLICFPDFVEVQLNGRDDLTNALRLVVVLTPESPRTVKIETTGLAVNDM